jgi:TRAP-type C4-dicarboxylate transport system substrate-binding protein
MEEGLVDMGFVASVFEAPKLPLQNVTYLAPFGSPDARLVTRVVMALHDEIPAMNQTWADNNMKLLAGAAVDNYDLYTTFPVDSLDDIVGRKLLAPGPAANWIRGTGAIAVAGTLATYYNDLATGVADGALTLATGVHGSRLNEVVPYMTRVDLGAHFAGGFAINLDTWKSLPPLVQEVFVAEGKAFTRRLAEATEKRRAEVLAEMESEGLQISTLPASERRRWAHAIPNTARDWARIHGARGLPAGEVVGAFIARLRDAGVVVPRDWSARESAAR